MNWVAAAKGATDASSPFEYASRLTEVMLLGVVALRGGKKIEYDGAACASPTSPPPTIFCSAKPAPGGESSG